MQYRFLFLLLLLFVCTKATAVQYPSFEQVATKLYANYSVPEMKSGESIRYQKKRDGWHVAFAIYRDSTKSYEIQKEQLFWSSSSGKYKSLTMFASGYTISSSTRVSDDKYYASLYDFSRCVYFGYDGWDQDVIADYADYTGANDTIYESLARAYSNFSEGYAHHRHTFHLKSQQNLPEKERIDLFIVNARKGIAAYDVLRKRNPNFEVLVGSVNTKYYNEIMSTYDLLLFYNRQGEIQDYFKEELYDPMMRTIALHMLESCEQGGIIFTNGDNDTYPLWYLQWIKGIRTDVAVLNVPLLTTSYYVDRFRNGFMKVAPIGVSIPDSVYARESYFYKGEGNDKIKVSSQQFFSGQFYMGTGKQQGTVYYNPCKIVVHAKGPLKQYELLSEEDSAVIEIERNYFSQSYMAMLDILLTNWESRPVYMAISLSVPTYLQDYFYLEGTVLRFIPAKEKLNDAGLRWVGPVASAGILQKNMLRLFSSDTACSDHINGDRWESNIKLSAMYAAQILLKSDTTGALKMLNALYAFYPYNNGHLKPLDVYSLDIYYKGRDQKSGDLLGTALLDHIDKTLAALEQKVPLSEDDQSKKNRENSALTIAQETFGRNGRPALRSRAQKIDDKY